MCAAEKFSGTLQLEKSRAFLAAEYPAPGGLQFLRNPNGGRLFGVACNFLASHISCALFNTKHLLTQSTKHQFQAMIQHNFPSDKIVEIYI